MPSWSPDGSKIVFQRMSVTEACPSLYVMDTGGSNLVQLAAGVCEVSRIKWLSASPVMYQSYADIYSVNTDGSNHQLFITIPLYRPLPGPFDLYQNLTPDQTGTGLHGQCYDTASPTTLKNFL
jgi:hypothetical protein